MINNAIKFTTDGEIMLTVSLNENVSKNEKYIIEFAITDKKVLILDDNETNLKILSGQLKNYGFKVTASNNGCTNA